MRKKKITTKIDREHRFRRFFQNKKPLAFYEIGDYGTEKGVSIYPQTKKLRDDLDAISICERDLRKHSKRVLPFLKEHFDPQLADKLHEFIQKDLLQ